MAKCSWLPLVGMLLLAGTASALADDAPAIAPEELRAQLLKAEIVSCRKQGLNVYYTLNISCANTFLNCCETAIRQQIVSREKCLRC